MTKKIGIVVFEGVEELDFVGPWEVLSFWCEAFPQDGYEVVLISQDSQVITAANGLRFFAHETFDTCGTVDILIHPGGRGKVKILTNPEYIQKIVQIASHAERIVSVCTGALVYAAGGLLRNKKATTHHYAYEDLLAIDPSILLDREHRWVVDGNVMTCAGVSAGIDGALYLIGDLISYDRMCQMQSNIEYYPHPPQEKDFI